MGSGGDGIYSSQMPAAFSLGSFRQIADTERGRMTVRPSKFRPAASVLFDLYFVVFSIAKHAIRS